MKTEQQHFTLHLWPPHPQLIFFVMYVFALLPNLSLSYSSEENCSSKKTPSLQQAKTNIETKKMAFGRTEFIGLLASYLLMLSHLPNIFSMGLIMTLWMITGGLRWCYLAYQTLPRDLRLLGRGLKLLLRMAYVKLYDINIIQCFRKTAATYPNRVMYVFDR